MNAIHHCAGWLVAAAALVQTPALGQAEKEATLRELSIDDLKRIYLSCERAVTLSRLSTTSIAQCSVVYEALKWRAFDGDFEKLLAWSRSQSLARKIGE